jgi:hypothetical protein
MLLHKLLGLIAIGLTIWAMYPYIRDIHRGLIKPHVFSWVIWGSTTAIVGIAQFVEKGGAGSWSIIFSGAVTFYIAYLAYKHKSDSSITKSDYLFLAIAMGALFSWWFTSSPLWAVIILTSVDLIGYAPTFRKSYTNPYEESLPLFSIMTGRNLISAVALEHYSMTTLLFPVATGVANIVLILMIFSRRSLLDRSDDL